MIQSSKINILSGIFIVLGFLCLSVQGQMAIRNGVTLPARDTLYGLVVFAEVDYSQGPCPNNLPDPFYSNWGKLLNGKTSLPPKADDFFDQEISFPLRGTITDYYYQASFGEYVLLGDYLPEVVSVPCSKIRAGSDGLQQVLEILNGSHPEDTTLYTAHGFDLKKFDNWTITNAGLPKIKKPDGRIDLIYIIWRNNRFIAGYNTGDNSGYGVTPTQGKPFKNMKGVNNVTSYVSAFSDGAGFHITIAEHLHGIFGGNHWHSGGGRGIHTFLATPYNYGATAQLAATMKAVCGWDRWMMDWKNPQKKYLISAFDVQNREVDTENFSLETFPGGGEFLLRDHVTTGDAVRIRLPHIRWNKEGDVKNQYLWLEFREMKTRFDKYYEVECADNNNGKFPEGTPGLYAYIQVGKDMKEGGNDINTSRVAHPNGLASWLFPVVAEGNFDMSYRYDKKHPGAMICGSWNNPSIPVDKPYSVPNPFTGHNDLYSVEDSNFDGKIYSGDDVQPGLSVIRADTVWFDYHNSGDWMDAFSFATGKTKLSISTNPAPVPVYTFAYDLERNQPYFKAGKKESSFENRTVWLNGLSIEIINENSVVNGEKAIRIRIRWDDYLVSQSARWCGNIVLSPNDQDTTLPSLILSKRKQILLDRGKSATVPVAYPVKNDGEVWFSDTTVFTAVSGAFIDMEPRSVIRLDNGSRLVLKSGSKLRMGEKSKIIVSKGARLEIEDGTIIDRRKNARIITK